jgi:formylglycine-generating enzyme required for sulfatase activity
MELAFVPAIEFDIGSTDNDLPAEKDELPLHKVSLNIFWIEKTEITNSMYRICI